MNWPKQDYDSMCAFFGKPGENQTQITLPYPMLLSWDRKTSIRRIACNRKVADSLTRIFEAVQDTFTAKQIGDLGLNIFGGCLNVRKMRGGSSWSIHSWGAAVDIDDMRNQLKWGKDKARLAKADAAPFWHIVEREGWVSLGRTKGYDFQHFQAARL